MRQIRKQSRRDTGISLHVGLLCKFRFDRQVRHYKVLISCMMHYKTDVNSTHY